MNIEPATEKALEELAALKNVSVNVLLSDLADAEKRRYEQQKAGDMDALEAMQNGDYIPHDEMKAHFQHLRDKAQERL